MKPITGETTVSDEKPKGLVVKYTRNTIPKHKKTRNLSKVQSRAIQAATEIAMCPPKEIAYLHTVMCQTSMPYRNPRDAQFYDRQHGGVYLRIRAGDARDPETGEWIQPGLPYGPKSRLILMHINAEARRNRSPIVKLDTSMTAFARRVLGYAPNGDEINTFKDHLGRLVTARISLVGTDSDGKYYQLDTKFVDGFDLWLPLRVLWPSRIELNDKYFKHLVNHSVPLDERALRGLSHSAMGLDIYSWLAQRLHRITEGQPDFVAWKPIKDQFGQDFERINNFKHKFRIALKQALAHYPTARVKHDNKGLTLHTSPPPVPPRGYTTNGAEFRVLPPSPGIEIKCRVTKPDRPDVKCVIVKDNKPTCG